MSELETTDALSALAKSVHVINASRRVGWAKAYEAEANLDSALHDVNIFRSDRDVYRKALSFMFGMFSSLMDTKSATRNLLRQAVEAYGGVDVVLDGRSVEKGRRRGDAIKAADETYQEEHSIDQTLKADRRRRNSREWNRAHEIAACSLAGHYGFASVDEMLVILGKYQQATGHPKIEPSLVRRKSRGRAGRQAGNSRDIDVLPSSNDARDDT